MSRSKLSRALKVRPDQKENPSLNWTGSNTLPATLTYKIHQSPPCLTGTQSKVCLPQEFTAKSLSLRTRSTLHAKQSSNGPATAEPKKKKLKSHIQTKEEGTSLKPRNKSRQLWPYCKWMSIKSEWAPLGYHVNFPLKGNSKPQDFQTKQ